ncbi:methionine ABC transporter ATP-binding protein [Facklamia sp. 7083-14-GEN3]|uniref:methionine ABC transporter ATP-binding protein n=1 Tax=Facklamia sp. 7083-14-GEN3 TaxID=2973478 RepID=UPI00215BB716|nr:ATP-binding cassette domain-containing protein [Facklamia sp. 7083-14-GEN3]MCR8969874.1 ATP-binding cassette domain-containing protein [Facklamia sp. 7083-14-GEN3]
MIELIDVAKHYYLNNKQVKAVDEVSLTIQDKEIFGLVGESGAGKSTLLRFINLLEKPDNGKLLIDGQDLLQLSKQELRLHRKSVGMIFQHFNLLNNKTVGENITLPLKLFNYSDALPLDSVLDFVGLADKKNQYPSQLSGGQKQRVGIARALITKPKILLCDEPTSALDVMRTNEIVQILKEAHQQFDMTIIVVTHELAFVRQLCDRVAIMEEGRIIDVVDNLTDRDQGQAGSYYDKVKEVLS